MPCSSATAAAASTLYTLCWPSSGLRTGWRTPWLTRSKRVPSGPSTLDVLGAHVSRGFQAEQDDFALEVAPKLADILVVGIQNRGAAVREGLDQLVLGARDSGDGIEEFQMHGTDARSRLPRLG